MGIVGSCSTLRNVNKRRNTACILPKRYMTKRTRTRFATDTKVLKGLPLQILGNFEKEFANCMNKCRIVKPQGFRATLSTGMSI